MTTAASRLESRIGNSEWIGPRPRVAARLAGMVRGVGIVTPRSLEDKGVSKVVGHPCAVAERHTECAYYYCCFRSRTS